MIHIQGPATEEKEVFEASRAKALRKQREIVEQVTIIQGE
jgi:hypothetical protein